MVVVVRGQADKRNKVQSSYVSYVGNGRASTRSFAKWISETKLLYLHSDARKPCTHEIKTKPYPYTGTAVVYDHIEPGVRLISTIFHPVDRVSAVISSTVRSFPSTKAVI